MKPDTRLSYAEMAQRIVEHVAAHLDEAPDLDALATRACLSPFHFHRVFRGMVGETTAELARRLRLERAAWQLIHTERPISAIAFSAATTRTRRSRARFERPTACRRADFVRRLIHASEIAATCGIHFTADGRLPAFAPCNSGGRTMDVQIKEMLELRVATVRHVGPYNQISEAFARLGEIAGQAGLFAHPGAAMIAIFHDDPESTPPDQLRSDAGISVPNDAELPPSLDEKRLPAGRYATTLYRGPYEGLGDVWARFSASGSPRTGTAWASRRVMSFI